VRLFGERASAARSGFVLDGTNVGAVSEICRRLDGIPLAIELAAARVVGMRPAEIAARLDERFRLLTGGRGVERLDARRH
jgi:predicted ATPase